MPKTTNIPGFQLFKLGPFMGKGGRADPPPPLRPVEKLETLKKLKEW